MKSSFRKITTLSLALAACGIRPATATLVTLTSPDNKWSYSSDEFGASGEGLAGGGFAKRDFGSGLVSYSWSTSVLLTDGSARQRLASALGGGFPDPPAGTGPIGAGSLISDTTAGSSRTSVFNVPGFASLRVTLTQSVSNNGISQQYLIANTGASAVSLSAIAFHDVDLDTAVTYLNDTITSTGGTLKVSECGREVFFSASSLGYAGFLAGYMPPPGGGITGNLDVLAYNNFGIPTANLNQFRNVDTAAIGANMDADGDGVSDAVGDVGYLFQHNFTIPANGSISLGYGQLSAVPEPSTGLLGLLTLGFAARRRR